MNIRPPLHPFTANPYKVDQKKPSLRNRVAEEEIGCFFANTLGMLCTAGSDGYFKRLSPAWSTTLGWSLVELQSKPFLEFVHPDDRVATLSEITGLLAGRETILFENRYRCQDGSYKWLQWTANSMCPRDLIFAIARDITRSRELQKESLEASDREKERLGRELHDGLCQNLASIAALSTTLSHSLEAGSELATHKAREITTLLNETIGQARDMARGLDPVNLEQMGLAAALEAFVSNAEGLFGISCRFRCHPQFPDPGPEVGLHLYRIAQEAVNNAIHHGRGSCIEINLGFRNEKGLLGIRDDGRGISDEDLKGQGLGIHTMEYRSRLIGGIVKVERRAQGGTSVTCLFPRPSA